MNLPHSQSQKGNMLVIVMLIVVVVLIIAAAYYFWMQKNNTAATQISPVYSTAQPTSQLSSPNPASGSGQTAGWKTYTDPYNLFSLSYPTSWQASDPTEIPFTVKKAGKIEEMISFDQSASTQSFDSWCKVNVTCNLNRADSANFSQTTFNNKVAYKYTHTKDCSNCNSPFITLFVPLPANNTVLIIMKSVSPSAEVAGAGNYTFQEETDAINDPVLNQILTSFKFTN